MKRIVVKRLYWPWSWARFSARHGTDTQFTTLNRFIWSAVGWSLDTSLFWLSQPEVFFMLKRKRAKAIRSPASTRPSVKHATAGERRIRGVRPYTMWSTGFRTKVAQQKRAIKIWCQKITEQGLPFTAPVPMIDEACGIEAIQQMITRWPKVSTKVSASRVVSNFCSTVHMAKVSSIEHSKGRLHIECSEPENVIFVVEANYSVIWYPIPVFRTHFVDERVTEVYFPIYFDLNPT